MEKINWSEVFQQALPVIIYSVIILFITLVLVKVVIKVAKNYQKKTGPTLHIQMLVNIIIAILWIICIIAIGSQFSGFSNAITSIIASSGIIALGVSMAAQESLTNLIDGLFISFYKPFKIGDRVVLPEKNNLTGIITEMNLRHTIITTYNNTSYIISNSALSNTIIENSSDNDSYSYPIDVTITYDSDLEKATKLFREAVNTNASYIGPQDVDVYIREFSTIGVNLRASMVTKDVSSNFTACTQARKAIYDKFKEANINFATSYKNSK